MPDPFGPGRQMQEANATCANSEISTRAGAARREARYHCGPHLDRFNQAMSPFVDIDGRTWPRRGAGCCQRQQYCDRYDSHRGAVGRAADHPSEQTSRL